MIIDIALQGLTINKNGLVDYLDTGNRGIPGIITLSWFHCRPDLPQNVLTWSFKIENIKRNEPIILSSFKWYETLAYRQNAVGQSVLKIEVIAIQDQSLMTKIVTGVLGLGIKTVGGLILNPVASSVYETLTSTLELDKATIHKVGTATIDIDPLNMKTGNISFDISLDKKKVIKKAEKNPAQSIDTPEYALEAGPNGVITLNFSYFNAASTIM